MYNRLIMNLRENRLFIILVIIPEISTNAFFFPDLWALKIRS